MQKSVGWGATMIYEIFLKRKSIQISTISSLFVFFRLIEKSETRMKENKPENFANSRIFGLGNMPNLTNQATFLNFLIDRKWLPSAAGRPSSFIGLQ